MTDVSKMSVIPDESPVGRLLNQVYLLYNKEISYLKKQVDDLKEEVCLLTEFKASVLEERAAKATSDRANPTDIRQNTTETSPSQPGEKDENPNRTSKEISPRSMRRNLHLPKSNKRSRFSEGMPAGKRQKFAQPDEAGKPKSRVRKSRTVPLFTDSETQPVRPITGPILVPETCNISAETDEEHPAKAALEAARKPVESDTDIVDLTESDHDQTEDKICEKKTFDTVPETVPMCVEEEQEEKENRKEAEERWQSGDEEEDEESDSEILSEPMTAGCMDLSPPAHASTPLCVNRERRNLPQTGTVKLIEDIESEEESNDSITYSLKFTRAVQQNEDKADDIAIIDSQENASRCSETGSPVFGRNSRLSRGGAAMASQSPSLFDDPQSPIPAIEPHPAHTTCDTSQRKVLRVQNNKSANINDISNNSTMSPSVLDGRFLAKTSRPAPQGDGFLSTRVAKSDKRSDPGNGEVEGSGKQGNIYLDLDDLEPSPIVRFTRSQKRRTTQGRNSPVNLDRSSLGKSLKQTTLSQVFSAPRTTHLPGKDTFNGGRLSRKSKSQTTEEKEREEVEEAIQRSLRDVAVLKNYEYIFHDNESPEKGEISMTFSPKKSKSSPVFKVPPAPVRGTHVSNSPVRKVKGSDSQPHHSQRHSKRRKDDVQDDPVEIDVIDNNSEQVTVGGGESESSSAFRRLDLGGSTLVPWNDSLLLDTEMGAAGNGSLGPDVRLSELEGDVSGPSHALEEEQVEEEEAVSMVSLSDTSDDRIPQLKNDKSSAARNLDVCDDSSFDRLPQKQRPTYAYVEVVRKKAERQQLDTYVCAACEEYYAGEKLTEAERKEKMKSCRHKARYAPPSTPEHFWSIGIPDTQECEERGYFNKTQHKPSKFRRRRRYNQLFKSAKDQNGETEGEDGRQGQEEEGEEEDSEEEELDV